MRREAEGERVFKVAVPAHRPLFRTVGVYHNLHDNAIFAGQTGSTDAGEMSFKWRRVDIEVNGGFATWSVDGLAIAKIDLSTVTLGGGNILFGHSDTNTGSSTDANDTLLNVTLIDNISVSVVPEPASLSAILGLGMLLRRRR